MRNSMDRECLLLAEAAAEEEMCLVFEFSTEEDYYFKAIYVKWDGEEHYSRGHHVHVGTFQDSVLIENIYEEEFDDYEKDFDYRFFPYKGNYLRFYSFSDFEGTIFVKNSGEQELEVELPFGRFLIPPKACMRVGLDVEEGRITERKKPAIDKYSVWEPVLKENGVVAYTGPKKRPVLGEPRYLLGETVAFEVEGRVLYGDIYVVDSYGTFEQQEEPSYDIMVQEPKMLYKHIRESEVWMRVDGAKS